MNNFIDRRQKDWLTIFFNNFHCINFDLFFQVISPAGIWIFAKQADTRYAIPYRPKSMGALNPLSDKILAFKLGALDREVAISLDKMEQPKVKDKYLGNNQKTVGLKTLI